ncbi:MAG: peptidylprolyl isomerase [Gammaproteobacteria bacterium]|nr:peptidylprolyl isomerase [Gammaproteobacteria bacterium]
MISKFSITRIARLLTGLIFSCCAAIYAQAGVELDRIVAIVNDDIVMLSELEEKVFTIKNQLREQGTSLPPSSILEKQVLDRLILTKLQTQMAANTGIRIDDETLNRTISNIAAENQLTLAQFREILESDNYSYEKFREDIRNEILISRLRQRQVDNRVVVSEREIENFLSSQALQDEFDKEYRLAHILIATPEGISIEKKATAKQTAQKVLKELSAGQDFAQMAAAHSDGQQALDGGDLGWRKAGQVPTLFADFVADMQKGDVSELITSPSGYHIIKLTDVRTSEQIVVTQTNARHILIRPNELITEDGAKARLQQLKQRIEGGDDFAELAKGNSIDTVSAADGGNLGWVGPGDLVPQFEQIMDTLAPGEISNPFKTQFGFHIVQVLERREHDSTEDVKRAKARNAIRQRKMEEARENWLREMRDEAYVEYRLERP